MKISLPPQAMRKHSTNDISAFSLVETTIAIGLVAFCLVAMLGMVPVGLKQERKSLDQQGAMQLMTALAADMQTSNTNGTATLRYGIPLQAGSNNFYIDQNHAKTTENNVNTAYRVSYWVTEPSSNYGSYKIRLMVSQPSGDNLDLANYMETVVARDALN